MEPLGCDLRTAVGLSNEWCSHIEDPQVQQSEPVEAIDEDLGYQGERSAWAWYYLWQTTGQFDITWEELYRYLYIFAQHWDTDAINNIRYAIASVDLEAFLIGIVCNGDFETVKYLVETFDIPTKRAAEVSLECEQKEITNYLNSIGN